MIWKSLVNFILVLKAILSYPLPYYAAADLLEKLFFRGKPFAPIIDKKENELTTGGCAFRVLLVLVTIMMAVTIPHFSILMGFIGNFTGTMLSFIWPCYFHLKLKGDRLPLRKIVLDCFIIFLGVTFGIIGIYDSGNALIEAYQIGLPF
jgi:vesicular inhibitory amino acid transporter